MSANDRISTLVESRLPSYLLDEAPNLVTFLKAYYEWLETSGQASDALNRLQENQDVDTTNLSKFYEYFRREILEEFPEDVLADKRILLKNIKDIYRAKGTTEAHRLLFRLLYNEDIDFINPSEFILRASDGRWTKTQSVKIGAPLVGTAENLQGSIVTGVTSGATGEVTQILTTFESGILVKELFLKNVSGTFLDGETVRNSNNTISGKLVVSTGSLSRVIFPDVRFTRGGSGHQEGDRVRFNSTVGTGANGVVISTSDNATTFNLANGGSGYTTSADITISGGVGTGGSITITSLKDTETIQVYTDTIQGLSDTPIDHGPTYSSNSGIISANLASANASTALNAALGLLDVTVGTINSISVTTGNYTTLPTVTVIQQNVAELEESDGVGGIKGRNATITANSITGAITEVSVDNVGSRYRSFDSITVVNLSRAGTVNAQGDPVITGIVDNPGKFTDTKGFLSWNMVLQDNFYYQEYSYVLKTQTAFKTYERLVRNLVHPAGTEFFGQINIVDEIDFTSVEIEALPFFQTDLLGSSDGITLGTTTTIGIPSLHFTISPDGFGPTSSIGTHSVIPVIAPTSIISTANVDVVSVGRSFEVPSIDPTTVVNVDVLDFAFDVPTLGVSTAISPNTIFLLPGTGTVLVQNNTPISSLLADTIAPLLGVAPISLIGDGFVVGNNTVFTTIVKSGSSIEIEDLDPGTNGNTIYTVSGVLSNTSLVIDPTYTGTVLANGIFRYTYDGNI